MSVSPVEAPPVKYVVFRLGGAVRLALPQMAVREGLDMTRVVVAPMPGAAAIFQGIANVRGDFLWVLDLARFLRQLEPNLALPVTPQREGLVVQGGTAFADCDHPGAGGVFAVDAQGDSTLATSAPQGFVSRYGALGGATGGVDGPPRLVSGVASIVRELASWNRRLCLTPSG
jgi:hypothetical protein